MAEVLLIDTDVIIDYLRGHPDAIAYVESLASPVLICAVTVAELYAGVREGEERRALEAFLSAFEIVPVDKEAAVNGGLHRRDYGKSHNVELPDALVAAAAQTREATLVTLNKKHFPMMKKIIVPYTKGKKKSK